MKDAPRYAYDILKCVECKKQYKRRKKGFRLRHSRDIRSTMSITCCKKCSRANQWNRKNNA